MFRQSSHSLHIIVNIKRIKWVNPNITPFLTGLRGNVMYPVYQTYHVFVEKHFRIACLNMKKRTTIYDLLSPHTFYALPDCFRFHHGCRLLQMHNSLPSTMHFLWFSNMVGYNFEIPGVELQIIHTFIHTQNRTINK